MGLLETALEHVSFKGVLVFLTAALVLHLVITNVEKMIRLKRLGPRAPRIPTKLPLGLDFVRKSVHATIHHKNLEMWSGVFESVGGWTAETRILDRRILFTADPENIKALLATQFTDFGKGEPFHKEWEPFLGDSIFATDGHKWSTSRQLLRPSFIRERVSDLHTFEHHLQTFFRAMANGGALNGENQYVDMAAVNGKVFDVSELLFRYTLDVATDFLLGEDVKSMSTPREEFADCFNEVQRVQNIISRSGPLNPLVPRGSYRRGLKVVETFINKFIDRALRMSEEELASHTKAAKSYTFLHEIASFTRDRKVLRDQIMAVLLAGRDTTAATLSWTLYELGRHPEVLRKLRQEIGEVVGWERTPTYEDMKNMKYLQNVMNETLRLYPAVPFNVRLALKDALLPRGGGPDGMQPVAVLKDTPIGYSTMIMQRRPELYPPISPTFADPAVFSPERWTNWQPKPWQYIPFNGGARICLGQGFALTEMGYVLTRMFQKFDRMVSHMDQIDGGSPKLKAEIVLQPGDGVKVAFWEAGFTPKSG